MSDIVFEPVIRQPGQQIVAWLVRGIHRDCLGVVQEMAAGGYEAWRNGRLVGRYVRKAVAGAALLRADRREPLR